VPDLLSFVAWTLAIECAAEGQVRGSPWRGVAALEVERAVSHLVWLRALGRLLGWRLLVGRCTVASEGLPSLTHHLAGRADDSDERAPSALSALQRASARAHGVAALVRRSRVFRLRTAGVGTVTSEHAEGVGLRGPVARASGLGDDARAGDAFYDRLGFEPVVHGGGDAYARTLVRTEEAQDSLRLAGAALRADADGTSSPVSFPAPGKAVEGPRGPVDAEQRADSWRLAAPGTEQALRTAGEAMVGAEWSDALVALGSFDLSPWRVGA
jgi:Ni,Fe-hydrogenase III large subunit